MSIVYTDNTNYTNIANAIRNKGVDGTFKPSEMPTAIASIPSGGGLPSGIGGIAYGTIIPDTNLVTITITHNLNTTDIMLASIWTYEDFADKDQSYNHSMGKVFIPTDLEQYSSGSSIKAYDIAMYNNRSTHVPNCGQATSTAYIDKIVDANNILFERANSGYARYLEGVVYHWIVIAKAVSEG